MYISTSAYVATIFRDNNLEYKERTYNFLSGLKYLLCLKFKCFIW